MSAALKDKTVVIVHGWSDKWQSMTKVGDVLKAHGAQVFYANYDSREDKAVYEDFAEGLDQSIAKRRLFDGRKLNLVTHSTGALVARQWLVQYPKRQELVDNVVMLAPANFGSPLANVGNSLIGKVFKSQHEVDDRFEVGREILHGLELASPFSWRLAEADVLGAKGTIYGADRIRASVITGHAGYGGLRKFVNKPGTDGTIVVAGANLNSRYLKIDFSDREEQRTSLWHNFDANEQKQAAVPELPFTVHNNLNHASILDLADRRVLREQVVQALRAGRTDYMDLKGAFDRFTDEQTRADEEHRYQQVLFRVVDERNCPVRDYHLEFNVWRPHKLTQRNGGPRHIPDNFEMDEVEERKSGELDQILADNAHSHSQDSGYKRFLFKPEEIRRIVGDEFVLTMRIDARTGDRNITYRTDKVANFLLYHPKLPVNVKPFFANTTTLIQIRLDRESTLVQCLDDRGEDHREQMALAGR